MTKETTNSISTYLYKGELHRAYYSYSNSCLKDLDMFTDCLELNLTQNRVDRHVEPRHSVTLFSFPTVAERTSVEETTKLNVQIKTTGKKIHSFIRLTEPDTMLKIIHSKTSTSRWFLVNIGRTFNRVKNQSY